MKKIYLAALTLAMTACVSNEDLNPVDNYGYIDLNVSNDPVMVTRTEGNGTNVTSVNDLNSWYIYAIPQNNSERIRLTSELTKVEGGEYAITASNFETVEKAYEGRGNKYYIGGTTQNIYINPGETKPVTIECGKAQNGCISAEISLTETVYTEYGINVSQTKSVSNLNEDRSLMLYGKEDETPVYFVPGEVSYTLSYKYNGSEEAKTVSGTITCEKAINHIIKVSSTDNGNIQISVTYDEKFGEKEEIIEIDAATGEKVETSSQGE